MVQLMNYAKLRPETELPVVKASSAPSVKLEVEDQLDEEYGPFNKRSRMAAAPLQQQWEAAANVVPTQAMQFNLLNEPSPLGLRLRKSPSLLDLIQMKLSQAHAGINSDTNDYECSEDVKIKDNKSASSSAATEKLKASNFPASILRIGSWEYVSRYEGDLVAKCYFAKHKLVWEVLEGGLKSKMEIQWSDITALKATCPENEPGTLDIVLARQPLFFRETNPQPRKHTLWQATSDFTDGQASLYRKHFLQCPPGLLNKHFEKLIQCDPRLYSLSQQPDVMLEKPFFEPRCSLFEEQDEPKCQVFNNLNGSAVEGFRESSLPCASTSNSTDVIRAPVVTAREVPSPSSVMDARAIEENAVAETERFKRNQWWDQVSVPGIQPSISMSDFVNQIGHCISEQMNSGNSFSAEALQNKDVLEDLTQYLFNDFQNPASDEQILMSRVNSFCNLLQKDGISISALHSSTSGATCNDGINNGMRDQSYLKEEGKDVFGSKQATSIPKRDSFGDLLMQLPRIASLPQFLPLFKISEDENYDNSSPSS